MPRHQYTPSEIADFVSRYERGEPCQSLARSVGVTDKVIQRVLERAGVYEHGRKFRGRLTAAQKDEMARLYLGGATQGSLAVKYGCSRSNVHILLRGRGIKFREHKPFEMSDDDEATIRKMRKAGSSFVAIAAVLGLPHFRVLGWGRELGLSDNMPKCGPDNPGWKGGRHKDGSGYWAVRVPADDPLASMRRTNGYVTEHRLVVARALGRPLLPSETVHHIDGDRANNRLENLQLRQGLHGSGVVFVCKDCGSTNVESTPLAA